MTGMDSNQATMKCIVTVMVSVFLSFLLNYIRKDTMHNERSKSN